MANIKSQIKRNKQSEKKRLRNRTFRGAAWAHAERAGTMASRNGSAMVTPTPFSTVRREMCFRDRNISTLPQASGFRHD